MNGFIFFSECMLSEAFPDGFLELPGLAQSIKTSLGESVVNPLVSSRLIEDLHSPGGHKALFRKVIQGVVQGAERECSSGHFFDLIPDPDTIRLVFEPPYRYQKNLLIDR